MDENYQAGTVETEGYEPMAEETLAELDSSWDSDDFPESFSEAGEDTDEAGSENAEADQPTAEDAADNQAEEEAAEALETEGQEQSAQDVKADQLFTLKHLDTVQEVDRDTVIALAQKGMDYDRKTEKLNGKIAEYESFFDEIAPSGLGREQFMDMVRAKMLVSAEAQKGNTISEAEAVLRVQQGKQQRAAEAAAEAAADQQQQKARLDKAIADFAAARTDVKSTDIPQTVWDEFHKSGDLMSAYAKHENAQLRKQMAELQKTVATLKKNAENAKTSMGSAKSAGKASSDSEFDRLWYDGE